MGNLMIVTKISYMRAETGIYYNEGYKSILTENEDIIHMYLYENET